MAVNGDCWTPSGAIDSTDVLGVRISAVNPEQAKDIVLGWIRNRERHYVTVTGVHGVVEAQDDPEFKAILNDSGLCVPDGMPMVWLSRSAGKHWVERVFGPDFMLLLTEALSAMKGRAFYYGGAPGVAEELAAEMERRFPGIVTAGCLCPPFRELTADEEHEISATINSSGADVVWVGLSTPKQEKWMAKFGKSLKTPVLLGVGAAFDYNTGRAERAPRWMQRSGLEWLYRIIQDPERLWKRYARNNPLFIMYLVAQRIGLERLRSVQSR